MKACFKCGKRLPLSEFYRHPMMGDGHLGKCKVCTRRDVQQNRAARREQYLEYERRRSKSRERISGIKQSQRRHPMHHRARIAVQNAVARGKMVKPNRCEDCGALAKIDGHHTDYTKPLDVIWLCRPCHGKRHRMETAA